MTSLRAKLVCLPNAVVFVLSIRISALHCAGVSVCVCEWRWMCSVCQFIDISREAIIYRSFSVYTFEYQIKTKASVASTRPKTNKIQNNGTPRMLALANSNVNPTATTTNEKTKTCTRRTMLCASCVTASGTLLFC